MRVLSSLIIKGRAELYQIPIICSVDIRISSENFAVLRRERLFELVILIEVLEPYPFSYNGLQLRYAHPFPFPFPLHPYFTSPAFVTLYQNFCMSHAAVGQRSAQRPQWRQTSSSLTMIRFVCGNTSET